MVRLDSGHGALDIRIWLSDDTQIDYLLKWNPRRQNKEDWLALAETKDAWVTPSEGKRVALFSIEKQQQRDGKIYRFRRVMQITERTSTASGQMLLLPEIEIESKWTSFWVKRNIAILKSLPCIKTMQPQNSFTVNLEQTLI